ncbi:MAG: conjugal transfer protein TraG N-terminal domain-containing protein [Succinivibrionaceae bacterium]
MNNIFNIYSIGDGLFLYKVINATSMIFESGIGNALAMIGLLLGCLGSVLCGAFMGRGIQLHHTFVLFLIYLLFFTIDCSVNIDDVRTSKQYKVDNVPLVVGFSASLLSKIGFVMSDYIYKAFSTPDAEKIAFVNTLELLGNARKNISIATEAKNQGFVFSESWSNFFKECTLVGIDLQKLNPYDIYKSANVFNALKFDSNSLGTAIYVNGKLENLTCANAYQYLIGFSDNFYTQVLSNKSNNLSSALSILGDANVSVKNYSLNHLLYPIYEASIIAKLNNEHAFNNSLILANNIEQRNTSMALSQSIFATYLIPIITFLEALAFFITPFLPLVITLSPKSLTYLTKYFSLLFWIQLWQPISALVNIYIITTIKNEFLGLGVPIESFEGIIQSQSIIQNYLGLGGFLNCSIPLIALFIVFGSIQSISGLVQSIGSNTLSSVGVGAISPNILENAPLFNSGSLFSQSPTSGLAVNGSNNILPQLSLQKSSENIVAKSQDRALSAQQTFSKSFASMLHSAYTKSNAKDFSETLAQKVAVSNSNTASFIKDWINSYQSSDENSNSNADVLLKSSANGSHNKLDSLFNIIGIGNKNGFQQSFDFNNINSYSNSSTMLDSAEYKHVSGKNSSSHKQISQDFLLANTEDFAKSTKTVWNDLLSNEELNQLQKLAQNAISEMESFQQLRALRNMLAVNSNLDTVTISNWLNNTPDMYESLGNLNRIDHNLSRRTNELLPLMYSQIPNKNQAYCAASFLSLIEQNPDKAMQMLARSINSINKNITDFTPVITPVLKNNLSNSSFSKLHIGNQNDEYIDVYMDIKNHADTKVDSKKIKELDSIDFNELKQGLLKQRSKM